MRRIIFILTVFLVLLIFKSALVLAVDYGTFTCTQVGGLLVVTDKHCLNGGTIGACFGAGTFACNAPAGGGAGTGGDTFAPTSCGSQVAITDDLGHIVGWKNGGISTAIGCIPTANLGDFLKFMLTWIFGAAGGVVVLMVIFTGYTLLTSSGNPEKLKEVQENAISIISGLLLIVFSLVLLQVIGVDILGLPGFRTP